MHRLRDRLLFFWCALCLLVRAIPVFAQASPPPWPHVGSDIAPDPAAHYGVLDNGMRYVIMRNQLPPGGVAIQMVYDFGSLYEAEDEKGLAHFIEHMAFNGTTHVPEGEMVKILERLGLAFGADTNAMTSYHTTNYLLNLKAATEPSIDESLFFLREVASEVTFDPAAIDRERGIVLSEWRESRGAYTGWMEATVNALAPGSLLSKRLAIGERAVIETAPRERMVSLYERYYRPERATLVVVGDIDVERIRAKIEARFADWKGKGAPGTNPAPYQLPERPTTASVYAHPDAPDVARVFATTPMESRRDSLATRRQEVLMSVAFRALLQRLSPMINLEDPPFQDVALSFGHWNDAVNTVSLGAATKPGGQKAAIQTFEKEWRRAVLYGFTRGELDAALAAIRLDQQFLADRETTRWSTQLNGAIVFALREHIVFSTPSSDLARFEQIAKEVTPELVHAELRRRMATVTPQILVSSSLTTPPGYESELLQAFEESAKVEVKPLEEKPVPVFAYTDFGPPGKVVSDARMADIDARQVTFTNNVRLSVMKTPHQKNLVYASVRIGNGMLDLPPTPGLGSLISRIDAGGLEKHSADDLSRMFPGRLVQPGLSGFVSFFGGKYSTTPADLLLQLQLAAAFTVAPGFRLEAERAFRRDIEQEYAKLDATARAVWWNRALRVLASGDTRWGFDPSDKVHERTFAELKPLVMPVLTHGPVEIAIVGDIDEQRAVDAVAQTFGALPERARLEVKVRAEPPVVFRKESAPIVLSHTGESVDGLVALVWPVAVDPELEPRAARVVRLMSALFGRKVLDEVREALGVAYSPSVYADISQVWVGFNHIEAMVNVDPASADVALDVLRDIAARMRAGEISDDEMARLIKPELDGLAGETSDNAYWIGLLEQAQSRPAASKRMTVAAQEAEIRSITKAELVAAANAWLTDAAAQEVRILPAQKP